MHPKFLWPFLVAASAMLSACGGGGGGNALMSPGENCLAGGCHNRQFSAAGTVFGSPDAALNQGLNQVTVQITDANGAVTSLGTNAAGNFYTGNALALPLKSAAVIRNGVTTKMVGQPQGACGSCHVPGTATGLIFAK